jgi:uncharacterized caspase-like protein
MFRRLVLAVTLVCSAAVLVLSADAALAERRVALVIGNASYKNTALTLPNPKNDATDVAALLRKLDFEVVEAVNVDKRGFEMALQKFARAAIDADSALFFYAGHAMQYHGRNFLMPIDAELEDEISLRYQMVPIDDVRAALDRVNGVKIMILDACRNNPLAERMARQSTGFTRAIGATRGLARIDKTQGMVVAYATAAEEVAADGNGRNSPFTQALLKRLQEPGLEIEQMFRAIARDVWSNTGGRQRPETYVSLLSEYYLNQADRLAWDKVKDSTDVAALRDFIARFPSSIRSLDARYRLEMLERFARERELDRQKIEREAQARREAEERARVAEAERLRKEREDAEHQKARVAEMERLRKEREEAERHETEERARLAEAERQRKAREAEEKARVAVAACQRVEAERRENEQNAKLALAERQRKERETAERRKVEERARLAEAERLRKESEAAQRREAEERARVAEAERVRKEREQIEQAKAQEQARLAEAERVRREQQAAARAKAEELAKIADAERARKEQQANAQREQQEAQRLAAADRSKLEQVCRQEDERLALLQAAGNGAREELARFANELSCERLRPVVVASLGNLPTAGVPAQPKQESPVMPSQPVAVRPDEPAAPADSTPPAPEARPAVNTIELVTAAQTELKRLGCFSGRPDGKMGDKTHEALKTYLKERDLPTDELDVTDDLIKDMKDQGERVCPLECDRNEVAKGGRCVAAPRKKSAPVAHREEAPRPSARQRRERQERPARVASQPVVRQSPAPSSRPAPKVLGVGF